MRILERCFHHPSSSSSYLLLTFGPFNSSTQRRWKKPTDSAQTRLENRTIDLKLDKLTSHLRTLSFVFQIRHLLLSNRRRRLASSTPFFVSVQSMSRWNNLVVGLNVAIPQFLRKYPHVFDLFTHPVSRNLCCKITPKMRDLVKEEDNVVKGLEFESVMRVKKLLMMSRNATLHVHALRLIRRELGLPVDFRDSILGKYTNVFKLIDLELVQLIDRDDKLSSGVSVSVSAEIEKWREKEYTEKWLSEFETKYAFPINLPTGFKMERGFRVELKNWQRLQYLKPYEEDKGGGKEVVRVRTCGGVERFEKRAVGILHELLSLTVEKMVEVERLAHFKKDFGMKEVNVRELVLKHPGIFYISTKGNMQLVFLRQAYSKGCLTEPNAIYDVRRKMLDLLLLGCRNTRELQACKENKEQGHNVVYNEEMGETKAGDWIIPILNNSQQNFDNNWDEISDSSK